MRFPPALLLVGDEPWEMTFMDKLLLEIGWPGSQDTRGAVEGPWQGISRPCHFFLADSGWCNFVAVCWRR